MIIALAEQILAKQVASCGGFYTIKIVLALIAFF